MLIEWVERVWCLVIEDDKVGYLFMLGQPQVYPVIPIGRITITVRIGRVEELLLDTLADAPLLDIHPAEVVPSDELRSDP